MVLAAWPLAAVRSKQYRKGGNTRAAMLSYHLKRASRAGEKICQGLAKQKHAKKGNQGSQVYIHITPEYLVLGSRWNVFSAHPKRRQGPPRVNNGVHAQRRGAPLSPVKQDGVTNKTPLTRKIFGNSRENTIP